MSLARDTCSSFVLASLWFCLLTRCLCLLQVRPASLVEWRWQLGRLNMMELTRNWQYLSSKSIVLYSYSNYGYLYVSITIAVAVAVRESRELGFAFPDFFMLYILTSLRNQLIWHLEFSCSWRNGIFGLVHKPPFFGDFASASLRKHSSHESMFERILYLKSRFLFLPRWVLIWLSCHSFVWSSPLSISRQPSSVLSLMYNVCIFLHHARILQKTHTACQAHPEQWVSVPLLTCWKRARCAHRLTYVLPFFFGGREELFVMQIIPGSFHWWIDVFSVCLGFHWVLQDPPTH